MIQHYLNVEFDGTMQIEPHPIELGDETCNSFNIAFEAFRKPGDPVAQEVPDGIECGRYRIAVADDGNLDIGGRIESAPEMDAIYADGH